MGQCISALGDERTQQLEQQVAALQHQLHQSHAQQGGAGGRPSYAAAIGQQQQNQYYPPVPSPAAPPGAANSEVLWFPDPGMPCKFGSQCRRGPSCNFAHGPTSLVRLLQLLGTAQRSLDICVFNITCNELAAAVIAAHRRGVRVRIITDNDQANSQGSDIGEMRSAGISVRMDKDAFHMHHKFAIIDGRLLLNGSFNWTRQAVLSNQENVVASGDGQLINSFQQHYEQMWRKFA